MRLTPLLLLPQKLVVRPYSYLFRRTTRKKPAYQNPHLRKTNPSQTELEAVAALRIALRQFLAASDRITRAHGLTSQRYDLLAVIEAAGPGNPPSVSELAQRLALAPHSVTELVTRAEEVGLVLRLTDDCDRRVTRVTATPEGQKRLEAALVALRPARNQLLDLLADVYDHAQRIHR